MDTVIKALYCIFMKVDNMALYQFICGEDNGLVDFLGKLLEMSSRVGSILLILEILEIIVADIGLAVSRQKDETEGNEEVLDDDEMIENEMGILLANSYDLVDELEAIRNKLRDCDSKMETDVIQKIDWLFEVLYIE